ncbi:hypothetical protein K443DRAFT_474990 [Laccaria amethystina LaAM-08-1]|uniref:Uncharacterized protein n=1 Tax=Laccaria amethystina LaAM-08-1 TaxID=1095629 RepID=A0A0C9X586_9AGAR|nr:hypothetical protein K443DRAFT_474990 [Laccaria amethystina LaAM-08-1]
MTLAVLSTSLLFILPNSKRIPSLDAYSNKDLFRLVKPRSSSYTVRCPATSSPFLFLLETTPIIIKNRRLHATGSTRTRFLTMHGRTTSFFKETDLRFVFFLFSNCRDFNMVRRRYIQAEFTFTPDDGSAIDVLLSSLSHVNPSNCGQTNTTQTFTSPTTKDSAATYAASTSALVQLSSGVISLMGYDATSGRGTAWATYRECASQEFEVGFAKRGSWGRK